MPESQRKRKDEDYSQHRSQGHHCDDSIQDIFYPKYILQQSIDEHIATEDDEVQKYELADDEMDPGELMINLDLGDIIRNAVDSLSSKQRMTFILKHYEGYKIREIADMLNCKEGTVKKYLFDAIRNLRKKLKPVHQTA